MKLSELGRQNEKILKAIAELAKGQIEAGKRLTEIEETGKKTLEQIKNERRMNAARRLNR